MRQLGLYDIALLPSADEDAFVAHMRMEGADDRGILQLTRITSGFQLRLLRRASRRYAWLVTAQLVTDAGYDFGQNLERLQADIADFGVVLGVDTLTEVDTGA